MTEIQKAIHIPKGKIVPNWVLRFKNKKHEKHKIKSNGFYVVKHEDGALYMFPETAYKSLIIGRNLKNIHMETAPYTKYGSAMFLSKEDALEALNKPVINSRGVITKLPNSPKKKRASQ